MYSPPTSPLSIGGVIDDALRLFRASFARCWLLAIVPGLLAAAYQIAFPVSVPTLPAGRPTLSELTTAALTPRAVVLDLAIVVLSLVFQGAVLVRQLAIVRDDEPFTTGRALATSLRRLPGMILGTILFGLAIALGTIALIIPGLWLWGRLQLWSAALFVEDVGATDALGASWHLTRGNWWRGAVIFTVAVIIVIVLTMIFSFLGGVLAVVSHVSLQGRLVVLQVASLISNAIYYPFATAIWITMYQDFKLRREGGDLASRAGALGRAT